MFTPKYAPLSIRLRQGVEKRIVKATVKQALAMGYKLALFDGEEYAGPFSKAEDVYAVLMETDEDYLYVVAPNGVDRIGWVRFVYGNDGWDVINDYTCNLEDLGVLSKALALVDKLQ